MLYYTIRLSTASQDMTTTVTEFGKFRYNHLPMGMCALGDLSQSQAYNLIGDIEGFKAYINYILVLSKDSFYKRIYRPRIIFGRLQAAGLKVNAPKYSFGLKEIPYLGYAITWEIIKPDPKKLQGIMDLGRTNTMAEAQALTRMVQYYRDMWPMQSHILAPMAEAASDPKSEKILWNDALEDSFKELKCMVSSET